MKIRIASLYGRLMNIYGDHGNLLCLVKRCEWRGIAVEVVEIGAGDRLEPGDFEILLLGGGQERQQAAAGADLATGKGDVIRDAVENGAAALAICGGFQLFCDYYETPTGERCPGIGLFDAHAVAGDSRLTGNLVAESQLGGRDCQIVGFENHSGRTWLHEGCMPLGTVTTGHGNNGSDRTEGALYKGAVGSYLHGPLLPKNPAIADFLIEKATAKYGLGTLAELDDTIEKEARRAAIKQAKKGD